MFNRSPNDDPRRGSEPVQDERQADAQARANKPVVELDEALRNNWVEIWYQPKIDLKRKCLAGAEALARIRHPALGVLLPGSFLPTVDVDGIAGLTEYALISTLRSWD